MAQTGSKFGTTPEQIMEKMFKMGALNPDGTSNLLQAFVDNYLQRDSNPKFWEERFDISPTMISLIPGAPKENPAYTVTNMVKPIEEMADGHTPLSEVSQSPTVGAETRTGTIPQFAGGQYETSLSKEAYMYKLAALAPQERNFLNLMARNIASEIARHDYRLSNLAAQVLSKGGAYETNSTSGRGVVYQGDPMIPNQNFVTCGVRTFSDADCNIPDQIQKTIDDYRNKTGYEGPVMLDVDLDELKNVWVKNKFFKDEVVRYLANTGENRVIVIKEGENTLNIDTITWEQAVEYSLWTDSKIPPIQVVKEKQKTINEDWKSYTSVRGWEPNRYVIRPMGKAGLIMHANITDIYMLLKEANKNVEWNYAVVNRIFHVLNLKNDEGLYYQYHTNVYGRYIPVLTEFMYHYVVKTDQAD